MKGEEGVRSLLQGRDHVTTPRDRRSHQTPDVRLLQGGAAGTGSSRRTVAVSVGKGQGIKVVGSETTESGEKCPMGRNTSSPCLNHNLKVDG